jgi:hypothetical protein
MSRKDTAKRVAELDRLAEPGRIEREWFVHGWTAALEMAARRLETANDETSKKCIAQAIRDLMP